MNIDEYKASIKNLVDATNNELLLKHWKKNLEHDVDNFNEAELSNEEWQLVQEGLADYEAGNVMTLDEFIKKR